MLESWPEAIQKLYASAPEIIARESVAAITGGLVQRRRLANLDSAGEGPAERIRVGGKVGYPKAAFCAWLASRMTVETPRRRGV